MRYAADLDTLLWGHEPHRTPTSRGAMAHEVVVASYDAGPPRVRVCAVRVNAEGRIVGRRTLGGLTAEQARAIAAQLVAAAEVAEQLAVAASACRPL